jgi:NAD(P)-dependent dehydrogenase (short-subunit alcohol dehydrogenase family)
VHVLVNNAGIIASKREVTEDGVEQTMAVNHLAPFLLTMMLLDLLRRSAPARIVNVSSGAQSPIDFDDVMLQRRYDGMRAYAQSKLAQVIFTFELAERLRAEGGGVTVNALHPASLMNTKMVYESFGYTMSTVEEGLEATLRVATAPELHGVTGRYFDRHRDALAHAQAYDEQARRRLWRLSEELVGLTASAAGP